MNRVILAKRNRLGWTAVLTAFSFGVCLVPLMKLSGIEIDYLTKDDLIKRLLILPLTVSFYVFVVCYALIGFDAAKAAVRDGSERASEAERTQPSMAPVIGVVWLNPLHRRDCPTEWRILSTLGLVKPNKDRRMMGANAVKPSVLRPTLTIARRNGETETLLRAHERYIDEIFALLGPSTFGGMQERASIGDLCVEYAIPAYRLDPVEVQDAVRRRIVREFAPGNESIEDCPIDAPSIHVHVTCGGANAGFASLNAALDYLHENPTKSVWVMNWDAPDGTSEDELSSENMALLVLAGARFEARRAPLALIGKGAIGSIKDYVPKPGAVRALEAWRDTLARAAANANSEIADIGYVVHDAGAGSDAASARLGVLGRALTETLAAFDYRKQTFNTAARLGDMGTGSALTNIAMAIGRANHVGEAVLVAGATDADRPVAVVVVPPAKFDGIDPDRIALHGESRDESCVPWWGRRRECEPAGAGG